MIKTVLLLAVLSAVCGAQTPPTTLTAATPGDKLPGAGGFLQRWLLLEPIPAKGLSDNAVQAMVKKDAYANLFQTIPTAGQKVRIDDAELAWHAMDTRHYNVNLYHFARSLGKPTSDILVWAVTVVHAPRDLENVRLAIGSNSASVWWVNGQEVIGIYGDRQAVIDDGVSRRLTLKKGANIIRAAIVNGGGATDFCARFLDATDRPVTGLVVRLKDR